MKKAGVCRGIRALAAMGIGLPCLQVDQSSWGWGVLYGTQLPICDETQQCGGSLRNTCPIRAAGAGLAGAGSDSSHWSFSQPMGASELGLWRAQHVETLAAPDPRSKHNAKTKIQSSLHIKNYVLELKN